MAVFHIRHRFHPLGKSSGLHLSDPMTSNILLQHLMKPLLCELYLPVNITNLGYQGDRAVYNSFFHFPGATLGKSSGQVLFLLKKVQSVQSHEVMQLSTPLYRSSEGY
jgi:hypothetical protein